MDRIELAERRYQQIVPEPVRDWHGMPVRELGVWLRDDVAPLVAEYVVRPKFRDLAGWSIRAFRPAADTPARRQVDATAEALVRHARLLRGALRSRRVAAAVAAAPPLRLIDEEVMVTGSGVPRINRTPHEVARLPGLSGQVEAIAEPFWSDLVDPADYLRPRGGWLLREQPGEHVTAGEFVVALNPELHAIGDFVTRCLFRRVEVLVAILEDVGRTILSCSRSLGRGAPKCLSQLAPDMGLLRDTVRQLYTACLPDAEAAVRDACVILTQVYAAFHPAPDVGWLGLDDEVVATGQGTLRHRFASVRSRELPERVAAALGDLRRLYANELPGQAALDEAVGRGGLVLITSPCTAYWKAKRLDVDWKQFDRPWKLLIELARKGRRGAAVEERHLFATAASHSAMATLYGRLKRLLPADLWKHIVPGTAPRSYLLNLDSVQLDVFEPPA